ncbi:tRNA (guanosine(37)-N1)-methyltransferase TrmD [Rhodocaloribacter litoris]|uniref:tRNA (guanosine(37)-N1)-methyltransferase TrmD n=1 Tax=Rhodocaloribacter litoris TaxID=2558931 RepID=UPI00141EAD98|nr:tRNA (guanosine(37)-N1)-methyltransferase TrmD [Rhodocaloribacter litoris]QXD14694.1 tRNA (guanosine(37)-N1)-methyltransferase TrmD [Rhodocaloribacter litoris]
MRIDIVTALPEIVKGPLDHSILRRARQKGLVDIRVHDLRDYAADRHRTVDDYPFGGGGGMVLKPEPIFACIEALKADAEAAGHPVDEVIYLTPDGAVFDQPTANALSLKHHLVLLAGHYKGVDQRVRDALVTRELSIGDYVLSGGELPALVVVDAIVRLIPGVLGDAASALSDSFQDGLLDAPVYTRPATFRGMRVPEVLRSGDHRRVAAWREAERLRKTRERRPDLLEEETARPAPPRRDLPPSS